MSFFCSSFLFLLTAHAPCAGWLAITGLATHCSLFWGRTFVGLRKLSDFREKIPFV